MNVNAEILLINYQRVLETRAEVLRAIAATPDKPSGVVVLTHVVIFGVAYFAWGLIVASGALVAAYVLYSISVFYYRIFMRRALANVDKEMEFTFSELERVTGQNIERYNEGEAYN